MKNKIEDLRNHMFAAIEELQKLDLEDEGKRKAAIEKAKAIASLGTVVVNSVKTEVDFYRAGGKKNMEVMGREDEPKKLN
jgi:hypothetical protein